MNSQAFAILEYQQLLDVVKRGAQTEMGKGHFNALTPLNNIDELRQELTALSECVNLRNRGVNWAFNEFADPAETISRLRIEGNTLDALAILQTAKLCEQALSARSAILAEREMAPVLPSVVENLPRELNSVIARVTNKILPTGEIEDRASPDLARIGHEISALRPQTTR